MLSVNGRPLYARAANPFQLLDTGPPSPPAAEEPETSPPGEIPRSPACSPHPPRSLTVLYHNINGFRGGMEAALTKLLTCTDPSQHTAPLLYALVESGKDPPRIPAADWFCYHAPGSTHNNQPSGGISVIAHRTCPIEHFSSTTVGTHARLKATAVATAIVAPHGLARFLLAVAYVHPGAAGAAELMQAVCETISEASADHPELPLLVVGDFNARHPMWHDSRSISDCNGGDTTLAQWVVDDGLHVMNPPNMHTHVQVSREGAKQTRIVTTIDLVLTSAEELVASVTQAHGRELNNDDHIPFTIGLALEARDAAPPPPPSACEPGGTRTATHSAGRRHCLLRWTDTSLHSSHCSPHSASRAPGRQRQNIPAPIHSSSWRRSTASWRQRYWQPVRSPSASRTPAVSGLRWSLGGPARWTKPTGYATSASTDHRRTRTTRTHACWRWQPGSAGRPR